MPGQIQPGINFLSDADVDQVNDLLGSVARQPINRRVGYAPDPYQRYTPDFLWAKLPTGGIPGKADGAVGTNFGKAECEIFTVLPSSETAATPDFKLDALKYPDNSPYKLYIYNPFGPKWYKPSGDIYIEVQRCKYGIWICEKPPYLLKAKSTATIAVGSSGGAADVWFGGAAISGESITAYLDWMGGTSGSISSGKEITVRWEEAQWHWTVLEAQCETS
jgi:hypothetical protein